MIKHKIWIKVIPQIMKSLVEILVEYNATFEVNMALTSIVINDILSFNLDQTNSDPMYNIEIGYKDNLKLIRIAKENLKEFTVHFMR